MQFFILSAEKEDPVDKVENYRKKIKHLDEHYEEHIDSILPENFHRGDLVSTTRTLGYADAVMATCATFLVIPLRNLKEMKAGDTLSHHLKEHKIQFVMYFLGFLVVLTLWESLNTRAIIVKRVDDFILLLNVFYLLGATALPFSLALQGHFPDEPVSVVNTCAILAFTEIVDFIAIWYAIKTPRVAHLESNQWAVSERRKFRNVVLLKPLLNLMITILGGLFVILDYRVSLVFISLLILLPVFRKLFLFNRRRSATATKMDKYGFFYHFSKGNIRKERVEAMTDAALAIVACILILDITVEDFPKKENVKLHGLSYELKHMERDFYAFLVTFAIVSGLWYVNHTVLHLFRTVNVVILYLQKIFLVFACLSPLVGNMINKYATDENDNAKVSILMSLLIVFFSSAANFGILIYGSYSRERFLKKWAFYGGFWENMHQHLYVFVKAANIPVWALICSLGTLVDASAVIYFPFVCFAGIHVTFFVAKFVFMNHFGKGIHNPETDLHLKHFSSNTQVVVNSEDIDNGFENASATINSEDIDNGIENAGATPDEPLENENVIHIETLVQ